MTDGKLLDFEEMEVWLNSQDLAVDVYEDFSTCRDFTFVDQIKRAAVFITGNIAEGAERSTKPNFARFLGISKGSTGEVRSMSRRRAPKLHRRKDKYSKVRSVRKHLSPIRRLRKAAA